MTVKLDLASLLAEVDGSSTLDAVETDLAARGLTMGVALDGERGGWTVARWLGEGAPGAPSSFADPADHLVAGLCAALPDGRRLLVHPCPRRAVGPDLVALAVGTGGRLARVERAWLRVHRREATRPAIPLPGVELDPPVSEAEARLLDAVARELGG